jgi:hypothetical protein
MDVTCHKSVGLGRTAACCGLLALPATARTLPVPRQTLTEPIVSAISD